MIRRSGFALGLLVLVACGAPDEASDEAQAIAVTCAPVEARSFSDERELRGTLAPAPEHHAIVSAEVPGLLQSVTVRVGDPIARGALLAEVEPRVPRDAVRETQASLSDAMAARAAAEAAATRAAHLFERGIDARQTVEAAEAEHARTEAAVMAARARLDAAQHGAERARVTAPLDGVVVRVFRGPGEVVDGTPTTPIVEIADPSAIELAASVAAADLVVMRAGQAASVRFDALPDDAFEATVRAVSPSIDPATGLGEVWLTVRCAEVCPPIGLLGVARVAVGEARPRVVVPEVAVRNGGGSRTEVVLCEDGHARVVEVTVGRREGGVAEITSGVPAGARVAVDEVTALEDGAAIASREREEAQP